MATPYSDEQPMPANATRSMFLVVAGFGIGALVVLFGFVFLVGIGDLGHATLPGPNSGAASTASSSAPAASPAAKSAANAPAAPGPAPKPAPNTSGSAVPSTNGQAPAPASPKTPRAPTAQNQHQDQQQR